MLNGQPTYISLFSGAGVGCYGFKTAEFACIATNELIERRLNIQRINRKCTLNSGYISGDITQEATKERIFAEIKKWKKNGNDAVDVIIATPPCQGMSVANHKKNKTDYNRNSLVVESIRLIKQIKPRFFILENVPAFMTTLCEAPDGTPKAIGEVIKEDLGGDYSHIHRILNFKNYGAGSSRTRTLVLGVHNKLSDFISPIELFPDYRAEQSLADVLQGMHALQWGEFDNTDFYHQFRTYDEEMKPWISHTPIGCSAFDNRDKMHRPHKMVNGEYIPNVRKNGDKYTRQSWNKVAPCIHTRNDLLASQNTIHPDEDRVFSIREIMKMMSVPSSFRWIDAELEELNALSEAEKKKLLRAHEINIRQSLGEAVPTEVFHQIAEKIKSILSQKHLTDKEIADLIKKNDLQKLGRLLAFIRNSNGYSLGTLSRLAELSNASREKTEAYFTNRSVINDIYKEMPSFASNELHILEPSVGAGNFIPFLVKKYEDKRDLYIDVIDIDPHIIDVLRELMEKYRFPANVHINYICADALTYPYTRHYDLVIGNPPFSNAHDRTLKNYLRSVYNTATKNTASFFMEKAIALGDHTVMIAPKTFLNTSEFAATRELMNRYRISCILDLGEKGFKNVLVETVCFFISTLEKPSKTKVISASCNTVTEQKQTYITDKALPYWILYRDKSFDAVFSTMQFDIFTVFRDRQITNSNTTSVGSPNSVRVLRSRNISDNGTQITDIEKYDIYIDRETLHDLEVDRFTDDDTVYLSPNMTYKPRMCKKPKGVTVNGSVAILIPKNGITLSAEDMLFYSTEEFRSFYRTARNYQTRSLNIDSTSVFFFGIKTDQNEQKG